MSTAADDRPFPRTTTMEEQVINSLWTVVWEILSDPRARIQGDQRERALKAVDQACQLKAALEDRG